MIHNIDDPVRVFLHRTSEDKYGTHGTLKNESGKILCYTIEPPWIENQNNISCIPEGVYECVPHNSLTHPSSWELTNVPGRYDILIHAGNVLKDTKGCILVGTVKASDGVFLSKNAMAKLHELLPPHFSIEIFSGE